MTISIGRSLIERRRAIGLSLDDVAHASRVSRQNLRWLEADELGNFPSLGYALAFLRFYGGVLGLDVEVLTVRARRQFAAGEKEHVPWWRGLGNALTAARTRRTRASLWGRAGSALAAGAVSVILAAAGLSVISHWAPQIGGGPEVPAPMMSGTPSQR